MPPEKWVNIYIGPSAMSENRVSSEQFKALAEALKKAGYTPLFGTFGVGGPLATSPGALGPGGTAVFYFNSTKEVEARNVAKLASEVLHIADLSVRFSDPQKADKVYPYCVR